LGRQFRDDDKVGPNYSDDMVMALLVTSGTASIGCIVRIFRAMAFNDKAVALEEWISNHPFYKKLEVPTN
jgi:hypothetical protein